MVKPAGDKRTVNGVSLSLLFTYSRKQDAVQQAANQRKYKNYAHVRVLPVGKRWGVFIAKRKYGLYSVGGMR